MRALVRAFVVLTLLAILPAVAMPQDIEARAGRTGRSLPAAYFARIARDSTVFEVKDGWRRRTASALMQGTAVAGVLPIAVIPARFAGGAPVPAVVERPALQMQLFDGPATSTITGFYTEVSRGKLTMPGRVGDWTPTTLGIAQVTGASMGLGTDGRVGDWLRQAVAGADAEFDFAAFDNDGPDGRPNSGDDDGRVDGAAFLFHERDASCGGPGIWPHRSRVSGWGGGPAITRDIGFSGRPIIIDDYIVLGAMDCSGTMPLESNVFAHEMGHVLGLSDYYDSSGGILRQQRRWVVGCWELMSAGAWGCGTGPQPPAMRPPHLGPHPKALLNWITPVLVPSDARRREFVLRPVRTSGDVLRVALSAREYLLLEYRDRQGFDVGLPAAGVLVYRVETNRTFLPCATCARTYSYSLLEADGNNGLTRTEVQGGNRGEGSDAFQSVGAITGATVPSSALNDSTRTTVSIHSIVVDPVLKVARVSITTAATPLIATEPLPVARLFVPFTAELLASGGGEPYLFTVQGLPDGVSWTTQRDRILFSGAPGAAGSFPLSITLRDALGVAAQGLVTLAVAAAPVVSAARVLAALRDGGASLSGDERDYLDQQGNRNGRFDIGDARAYLRRAR